MPRAPPWRASVVLGPWASWGACCADREDSPSRQYGPRKAARKGQLKSPCAHAKIGAHASPSKSLHHLPHMLDLRRRREAMAHQLAPFGEIRRAAKIDGVVLHRLPLDKQPIAGRLLDRALQSEAAVALGAPEHRYRLCHAGLEFRLHAGFHVDLGNFENHGLSL